MKIIHSRSTSMTLNKINSAFLLTKTENTSPQKFYSKFQESKAKKNYPWGFSINFHRVNFSNKKQQQQLYITVRKSSEKNAKDLQSFALRETESFSESPEASFLIINDK